MNYYEVLGVEPTADLRAIRVAWRIKVRLLHPDRHLGAPDAVREEAAKETLRVNDAYATLRDPEKRLRYDMYLLRLREATIPSGARGRRGDGGEPRSAPERADRPRKRRSRKSAYLWLDLSSIVFLLVAVCFMVVGVILLSGLMQ